MGDVVRLAAGGEAASLHASAVIAREAPAPAALITARQELLPDKLLAVELTVLGLSTPLLLFPRKASVLALLALAVMWLCRLLLRRDQRRDRWVAVPLLGLMLMTSVSLYPSVDLTLSLPKLYGLILGFYIFSCTLQYATSTRRRSVLAGGLILSGAFVSLVGLVGVNWNAFKTPWLTPVYTRLPHLIPRVQTSFPWVSSGIHANELGGVIALLLPLAVGWALFGSGTLARFASATAALLMAGTLVLSASRSALAGVVLAVALLAVLRWRGLLLLAPVGVAILAIRLAAAGPRRVLDVFTTLDAASGGAGIGRPDIWSRALHMIRDFPLTGIGLNTFPIVLDTSYPLVSTDPSALTLPHAHNLFLQTALDLGIAGLLCFLMLWLLAGIRLVQAWRAASQPGAAVAASVGAGLLAHLVFSQTDAVALGAKAGIFLWAMLAVALAGGRQREGVLWLGGSAAAGRAGVTAWLEWCLFAVACASAVAVTLKLWPGLA